jgi:hypothetical protein
MKRLVLFLLFSSLGFSQPSIDIRLVNSNVGMPLYNWSLGYPTAMNTSNDAGLNTIFSTYGVTSYEDNNIHPYPPYQQKTKIVFGTFPTQFITDLLTYSSVIESVKIASGYEFTDAVLLQLIDLNIGMPTGFNGNIVVTNDTGLNAIFQNFSVFYYTQAYPSASSNNLLRYYNVVCDCDKNFLKIALDNYATVIQSAQSIGGGVMLSNPTFTTSSVTIYPNPFTNNFNIDTTEAISNFSLFDGTGKQIVNTTSKTELDSKSQQLNAGFYILNLTFDNGQIANYKLVKK